MNLQEQLKMLLEYFPEIGEFRWKIQKGSRALVGSIAGTLCKDKGYIRIDVLGKQYPAHRLAWLYMTGEWPKNHIDHKNLSKVDNRWINLREATPSENKANSKIRPDNTSGFKGVSKFGKKWKAQCSANGIHTYLGLFDTPELASLAYQSFAAVAQGEFFRSN